MSRFAPRLNMLPLMDCIFLILAVFFFLILDMVVHRGIPVDLPSLSSSEPQEVEFVTISIDRDAGVYYEGDPVDWTQLDHRLRNLVGADPKVHVFISADDKSDYGLIARAIDAVRTSGLRNVALETRVRDS